MKSCEPHKTDPTGAHSALLRQNVTEFGWLGQLSGAHIQGCSGVEYTSAVQMQDQPVISGNRGDCLGVIHFQRDAAAAVVSVF